jgi:hypothetical protein
MSFKLIMGIVFLLIGCVSAFAYITKNDKLFSKKEKIKEAFGYKGGAAYHFMRYVIVPIILGITLIVSELMN